VARQAARMLDSRARAAGVAVRLELAADLPPLFGDPGQIVQVIINLIVNALEALEERDAGRELVITTRALDGQVELTVRDNGIGLPDELMPRLFDPFFTTKPRGLGMGLAISRSIAEFHGGRLIGEKNPDLGMAFRLRLPIARRAA
jgi:signal transduction histidine kinase